MPTHKVLKNIFFVDDLKLIHPIKTKQDANVLQSDINAIVKWYQYNRMELNASKWFPTKLTSKKQIFETILAVAGIVLTEVSEIRDLGVAVDTRFYSATPISKIL